jgi:hypothetical protein
MLRKHDVQVDAQTSMETEGAIADLEALEEDFAGDFDSLDENDEEEVSFSEDSSANADGQSDKPTGGEEGFDEDFSIDPDESVDADEDSWGEFDNEEKKE